VTGKHGDGIVGTRVTPQGTDLSPGTATTVKVSADLAFTVTVENSGDFAETNVPVTLTIDAGGTPIAKRDTIDAIEAGKQRSVTFSGFDLPTSAFGAKATITVKVLKVPGEVNLSNNTSTYTVFFTLS
jgi:multidrug efflux pump subunit AcrA (membrane-fusion protein)